MQTTHDILIVGAGIVGLATGYHLVRDAPKCRVRIVDKEPEIAAHQTGHNSGVLHSGIYYRPGSEKARNCRAGLEHMRAFCTRRNIPFEICGKVIVATDPTELPRLRALQERGEKNGVTCRLIDQAELRDREPHCAGIEAILVEDAGIVDYVAVCRALAEGIREQGSEIICGTRVTGITHESDCVRVETTGGACTAQFVINCAGLHSDRVTGMTGHRPPVRIIPFRGEYYELKPGARALCRHLIYPVPDPAFPFLGVHFTRMIQGGVECGPNAVLALAREGYKKTDLNLRDLTEMIAYSGFRKLVARHWRMGLDEMKRSISKAAFVRALQRLIPEIRSEDLEAAPAGVRAQAVAPDGSMADDFAFDESSPRILNVINAPSPAATASLSIGRTIADRVPADLRQKSGRSAA